MLLLKFLLIPAALGLLLYSYAVNHPGLIRISLILIGVTVAVRILVWFLASSARCPLCMTPVMANLRCATHKRAKRLFGSYRNRVAYGILFKGWFTCPYCHEQTAMQVRSSSRQSYKSAHPHD